jgi:hypothetical protein
MLHDVYCRCQGLGDEDNRYRPCLVQAANTNAVVAITAGPDSSFLVHADGRVYATGNNEYNKVSFVCFESRKSVSQYVHG